MGLEDTEKPAAYLGRKCSKRMRQFISDQALAGAIGGGLTRFLCQPFDVLKIRFQVHFFVYVFRRDANFICLGSSGTNKQVKC